MDQLGDMWTSIAVLIGAIATLVARYKGTNTDKSVLDRLMVTFDMSQIFDSTRGLDD
jgi:hypothetical protein